MGRSPGPRLTCVAKSYLLRLISALIELSKQETTRMTMILNRPLEVMIITALNAAIGAILLMNGLAAPFSGINVAFNNGIAGTPFGLPIVGSIMTILGSMKILIAMAFFGAAAGLFLGKGWGWTMSRVMQFAGIAFGFTFMYTSGGEITKMALHVLGMAMSGIAIGFLHTAEVREFYGKQSAIVHFSPPALPKKHLKRRSRRHREFDDDLDVDLDTEQGKRPSEAEAE